MVDPAFSDASLAELYDVLNPWAPSDDFYLTLVMSAAAVLDVDCGTGALLKRARQARHSGRLCGLDPAGAMLDQARTRSDIEWILGDLASVGWDQEFDLVVMTGRSRCSSRTTTYEPRWPRYGRPSPTAAVSFETRNPLVRAWEGWTPDRAVEVANAAGAVVRVAHEVETPVEGDVVRFSTTFTGPSWDQPRVSRSTLRFLDADSLSAFLTGAGLAIEERSGTGPAIR